MNTLTDMPEIVVEVIIQDHGVFVGSEHGVPQRYFRPDLVLRVTAVEFENATPSIQNIEVDEAAHRNNSSVDETTRSEM